jgi:hypothetical protein
MMFPLIACVDNLAIVGFKNPNKGEKHLNGGVRGRVDNGIKRSRFGFN